MKKSYAFLVLPILTLAVLASCGGGKQTQNTSTTTQTKHAASTVAMPKSRTGAAAVPSSLHCGATEPVWVNTKSRVYHTMSDPLYGKTKHGEYMCPQTAKARGYHMAGSGGAMRGGKHHKPGTMMTQPSPTP